jgi:hypothetical protein
MPTWRSALRVVALLGANPLPLLAVVLIEPGDETGLTWRPLRSAISPLLRPAS